ncbi:MAG TPA: HlyD family efflux transporter periplasmic adaptor subunit [Thermoanaerobaculia bacterium]|jgi:HlyD family secretion protein|nr:HlyD family efflux transporter periplasmic adaptor subunit [Thermoanaerobaculia bacterium]
MDIVRTPSSRIARTRLLAGGAIAAVIIIITVAFSRVRPASAPVEKSSVVIDSVKRGAMTREVRGSGTLVPENIRWIAASTDARVETLLVQPGSVVKSDTVIMELSDPQQQQAAADAEWQLKAADAELQSAKAQLESDRLDREAAAAQLRGQAEQARLRASVDADLQRNGLAANITKQLSQSTANQYAKRVALEDQRLRVVRESQGLRLAALQAQVEQRRALTTLRRQQSEALHVRAGIDGVLQQVSVQAGQRVTAGANLARVARPDKLKAEVRIAETQAKDIAVGQNATVDTRNGIVDAVVSRVDPAVREGTVTVDLRIDGPLPAGARPDLSVDAIVQLDRISDALHVGRPVGTPENSTASIFKVAADGNSADKVAVTFGRSSATDIEIRKGLQPGDRVIVSDVTQFDRYDHIALK